jgi:hypothetical protein
MLSPGLRWVAFAATRYSPPCQRAVEIAQGPGRITFGLYEFTAALFFAMILIALATTANTPAERRP